MKRIKYLALLVGLSQAVGLGAQNSLDSLYSIWEDPGKSDSIRSDAFYDYISEGYLYSNPDTAFLLGGELHDFGLEKDYLLAQAYGRTAQGVTFLLRGDFPKALDFLNKSLDIKKEIGDPLSIAGTLTNIGVIYSHQGDDQRALSHFAQSLSTYEAAENQSGIAATLVNLAAIYMEQEEFDKCLEYNLRALELRQENNQEGETGVVLMNLGNTYKGMGENEEALSYFFQGLAAYEKYSNQHGMALCLLNIGTIYHSQKQYAEALSYYERSLKINQELADENGRAYSLVQLGSLYLEQGELSRALDFCTRGYDLGSSIGALDIQKLGCSCLYSAHKELGNGTQALEFHETLNAIEDSLHSEDIAKKLQLMEFQEQMLNDSLKQAEEKRLVEVAHQQEVAKKEKTRNWAFALGGFILLLAIGLFTRVRYVRKAKNQIEKEKDRSENLLLNILPAEIAEELKEKGRADARDLDMVSILFTDFKGFTAASEKLTAQELVSEIDTCFEAFDRIMGTYGIEKIKTIGDAYMAAGGLPVPAKDSVKNTVLAALEIQEFVSRRKAELDAAGQPGFEMRVGIHTGPVVAGIVGVKKFQYDIWGDTVNTASRMESSGAVGKVNVSQATRDLLREEAEFTFESRGKISAKGKGEMEMYFVGKIEG